MIPTIYLKDCIRMHFVSGYHALRYCGRPRVRLGVSLCRITTTSSDNTFGLGMNNRTLGDSYF
jgi:hypothetical protein